MKQCPILELLEGLSQLIDDEARGRIDRWEYYKRLDVLKQQIDETFLKSCQIKEGKNGCDMVV